MSAGESYPEYKNCSKCQKLLHHSEFYKSSAYHNGIESRCKRCKIGQNAIINRREDVKKRKAQAESKKWRTDPDYRKKKTEYQKTYKERPGVKERYAELQLSYNRRRPERVLEISRRTYEKNKDKPENICSARIRARIYLAMRGKAKSGKTFELLGYTPEDLRRHIEKQFCKGMSWGNYGEWHIDHIVPLSSFEISSWDDPELKAAWDLTNLRPIWSKENLQKSARLTHLV